MCRIQRNSNYMGVRFRSCFHGTQKEKQDLIFLWVTLWYVVWAVDMSQYHSAGLMPCIVGEKKMVTKRCLIFPDCGSIVGGCIGFLGLL